MREETIKELALDYKNLRQLYREAVEQKQEKFEYRGSVLLTSYAKYLLEFIKPRALRMTTGVISELDISKDEF